MTNRAMARPDDEGLLRASASLTPGWDETDLAVQISSEIRNGEVREDRVAEVKARLEAGELDLSPERIARAILDSRG